MFLPINKKPLIYENKVYQNNDNNNNINDINNEYKKNYNYVKKNYKNIFSSKKFDLNDENQRMNLVQKNLI